MCKSKISLSRHFILKHFNEEESKTEKNNGSSSFNLQILTDAVTDTKSLLKNSELYPDSIKNNVQKVDLNLDKLLQMVNTTKTSDTEKFYGIYYTEVVQNSDEFVCNKESYDQNSATLLLMKLGNTLLHKLFSTEKEEEFAPKNLSDRELYCLQYLGGYVLSKLHSRLEKSKNFKSAPTQQAISLLLACRSTSNPDQKLVNALNRGGLWIITNYIQRIFVIAERYFCLEVKKGPNNTIQTGEMVKKITSYRHVKDFFHQISSECDISIDETVEKDTLFSIIKLYIRVRAFSHAKDLLEKYLPKKDGKKALRTELKQPTTKDV